MPRNGWVNLPRNRWISLLRNQWVSLRVFSNLLADLFKGQWKTERNSEFVFKKYGYFVEDKLEFYVDRFEYDKSKNKISFRKIRVHVCNEIFKVELNINNLYNYYVGVEFCSYDGGKTWGKSNSISFRNLNSNPLETYNYGDRNNFPFDEILLGKSKSKYKI